MGCQGVVNLVSKIADECESEALRKEQEEREKQEEEERRLAEGFKSLIKFQKISITVNTRAKSLRIFLVKSHIKKSYL